VDSIIDEELRMRSQSPWQARLVRFLDRWNLRWASVFICVTEKLREELIHRGARPERVFAVHNGAATDLFAPGDRQAARQRLGLPAEAALVGFVGTLVAWQGLDLLIRAAALLPDCGRPWQVLIVGHGELRDQLAAQIAAEQVGDRVRLLPEVRHEEVPAYLQALDAMVLPIHDERKLRYGLSALKFWEGLSVGLPVLVPDGGDLGRALRDLNWPGEYRTGDAADLAAALGRVIREQPQLEARRPELREAVCRRHSWDAVAGEIERIVRPLVEGR
jgi:glycosyltransferase involved in cell wall biosynthesis